MAPFTPQSHALADLLDREHQQIVEHWQQRVLQHATPAQRVSTPALLDRVPEFLRHVTDALRRQSPRAITDPAPATVDAAREHGSQRYRIGFDLRTVVVEYNLLREVVLDVINDSGVQPSLTDLRVLCAAFAKGIAEAVDQYSIEREQDHGAAVAAQERANEFERQLIAIVSHDLRSPLSAIQLAADTTVARGGLDQPAARQLARIQRGARRALRLIRDLLDFTRERRSGRIPVKLQPAALRDLVVEAIEEARAMFRGRVVRYHESDPLHGHFDPDRIGQVLSNLLTNALKYSSADTEVTVTTRASDGEIELEVHNFGAAIPASRLATLFEPFQCGDPTSEDGSSLGIGLHISRQIVLAHHGHIEVHSSDQDGTRFRVHLPRCPLPSPAADAS